MIPAALVSVDEYLNTSYDPDCDYVDGELVEREGGKKKHSELQTRLAIWFGTLRISVPVLVFVEQRVRVSPTRVRIPDVCVYLNAAPDEEVFTQPPFLVIEILSPDDLMARMQQRLDDYIAMGIPNVWLADPYSQRAWQCDLRGLHQAPGGVLRTQDPVIEIALWA